jgi:hypothetical protein
MAAPQPAGATALQALQQATLARQLGWAGVLPFVGGALLLWLVPASQPQAHAFAALALSGYAAVIISFLGGVHWGVALRQDAPDLRLLAWGVTPSLLAWVALLMPAYAALVVHGAVLLLCWAVDRRLYPQHGLERWLTLRFRLSAVASACCFLGAAAS